MSESEEVESFEQIGINAYSAGLKEPEDDPAFVEAQVARSDQWKVSPEDDWVQGWILAAYHYKDKAAKEEEASEN